MAKSRSSLASLPLASKHADPRPVESAKDERVGIAIRVSPAARKALRQIALSRDTTLQALAEEAVLALLRG